MIQLTTVQKFILWGFPVLFAVTIHEVAHGWVANKFGDKTAMMMGRLTLNPLKHIDFIGTILIPVLLYWLAGFVFGWAKPVPINPANFHNPKRNMALVAVAGPASNLIMAIIWALVAKFGLLLMQNGTLWAFSINYMGQVGIFINLILMVLNLIPIPPLDGSRVLSGFLSERTAAKYNSIEPYGFFILLALLMIGFIGRVFLPIVWILFHFLRIIIGF